MELPLEEALGRTLGDSFRNLLSGEDTLPIHYSAWQAYATLKMQRPLHNVL